GEDELAGVEDERLTGSGLDVTREFGLLEAGIDDGVFVIVEQPEVPVQADIDAGRLDQRRVIGIETDAAGVELGADVAVGKQSHVSDGSRSAARTLESPSPQCLGTRRGGSMGAWLHGGRRRGCPRRRGRGHSLGRVGTRSRRRSGNQSGSGRGSDQTSDTPKQDHKLITIPAIYAGFSPCVAPQRLVNALE